MARQRTSPNSKATRRTMGRHDRDDGRGRKHSRKHETDEERLLRKAREYVERNEDKQKRSRDDRDDGRSKKKRHRHEEERLKKKHRKKERRHRNDDSSEREDSRREKKESKRHKKKESRKKNSHRKEKRAGKKAMRVDKSKFYPLGDIKGSPPAELLDVEKDYFAFHQHLWVYLYREEGIMFGDLTSEDARNAFKRFVKRYNTGDLEQAYYDGLPPQAVEEAKTTSHKWSFKTSETERKSLHFLQEGVRKQTEYDAAKNNAPQNEATTYGGKVPVVDSSNDRRRMTAEERASERASNRRLREHVRTVEEELTGGKKDGIERQIEKRKEKAAAIHGAARDREEAQMGGVELNDNDLYGGGGDTNFQDAVARERRRTAQRQQKKEDRVAELKKKEQDKQDAMIKMLGLTGVKPGQKITIAPRKNP